MLQHDLKGKAKSLVGSAIAWMEDWMNEYIEPVQPTIYTPRYTKKSKGIKRPRLIIHITNLNITTMGFWTDFIEGFIEGWISGGGSDDDE